MTMQRLPVAIVSGLLGAISATRFRGRHPARGVMEMLLAGRRTWCPPSSVRPFPGTATW